MLLAGRWQPYKCNSHTTITQLLLAEADLSSAVASNKYVTSRAVSRLVYQSPYTHDELKDWGRRAHARPPWTLGHALMQLLMQFCDALLTDAHAMQALRTFEPSTVVVDFTTTCGLALADALASATPNASQHVLVMVSATGFVEPLMSMYASGPMDPATVPAFAMPLRHPMTWLQVLIVLWNGAPIVLRDHTRCTQQVNNAIAHAAIRYAADWMIRAPSDRLRY